MKNMKKIIIIVIASLSLLVSTIYATWIIMKNVGLTPSYDPNAVNVFMEEFDGQSVDYTGGMQIPKSKSSRFTTGDVIFKHRKAYSDDSYTSGGPFDAGTYEVLIKSNNDSINYSDTVVLFTVNPIDPTIKYVSSSTDPIFEGDDVLIEAYGIDNEIVSGTITTMNELTFPTGSTEIAASSLKVTFESANPNYNSINEYDVSINMRAVAHINSTTYYGTIEKAVNEAVDTNIVYVIPLLEYGYSPVIKENVTIKSGVTLCFPYEGTTYEDAGRTSKGSFADLNSTNVSKYRKNLVYLDEGKTITNNGKLIIGGKLGINGQRPSGHTAGDYAELNMKNNSSIINNKEILCYGYIKESSRDNSSNINNASSNSSITLPMVIYDYRGGTYSSAAALSSVLPFSIFDIPNSQVKMIFSSGAKLKGWVTITANDKVTIADPSIVIGTSSDTALFKLSSGSVIFKNNQSSFGYTTIDSSSSTVESSINKTNIDIHGNIQFSSVSLNIGISINTANFFFPISYKFDIKIASGTTTISNKVKILSGGSITVNDGATVNINASTILYRNYVPAITVADANLYPRNLGDAKYINNGTTNINASFGGFISTTNSSAKLITSSDFNNYVTSREKLSNTSNDDHTEDAKGFINSATEEKYFAKNSTYTSLGTYWSGNEGTTDNTGSGGGGSSCIPSGTLLTLADGTQKKVEDLLDTDMLLVFNHETGKFEAAPIIFVDRDEWKNYNIVNLEFSNGTKTRLIYEHGYFDLTLNKYVYITESNYQDYIGHEFAFYDGDKVNSVTLTNSYITYEYVGCYSPVTAYHLNYIVDGYISMPGGIEGLFNIFEYNDDMTYNIEKMNEDIEKYGLYTYEDFKDYLPYEVYLAFPGPYLKVSVEKGYITFEEIIGYIEKYLGRHGLDK